MADKIYLPQTARDIHTPDGRPAWDRPVTATAEEVGNTRMLGPDDGHRQFAWLLEGRYSELDRDRIMRGEVCLRCLHTLPECPNELGAYKRILATPGFDITTRYPVFPGEATARQRLAAGHCPICDTEMSRELAKALFAGDWDPEIGSERWKTWYD